jgi:hypothetical protein
VGVVFHCFWHEILIEIGSGKLREIEETSSCYVGKRAKKRKAPFQGDV